MDLKTFKKIVSILPTETSVIIRGRHGTGKSASIYQISKDILKLPVIEKRLSQETEGDLIGLPFRDGDRATKFLPPEWFAKAMEIPHVIFLDELDRSTREVQQAAMELILDRSIQGKKIHPQCRVFAAINGGKYGSMYNVSKIDPALNDRFWIADIEPSVEEWLEWGEENNNILPLIRDFIAKNDVHLETKTVAKELHTITPSRRAWKMLSDALAKNPNLFKKIKQEENKQIFISLCKGFVGIDATAKFLEYVQKAGKELTAEDIINSFEQFRDRIKESHISEKNFLIHKIREHSSNGDNPNWSKEQIHNVFQFYNILDDEMKLTLFDQITRADTNLNNAKKFSEICQPSIVDIINRAE